MVLEADRSKTDLNEEYTARINKVQDYVENNLDREFKLRELSQIANFSAFHFHRVFYSMTGETLFQFIQRIRLEKAVFLLSANRNLSITAIALKCGFSNQASFAKAFKKAFNISASQLRKCIANQQEDQNDTNSNLGKVFKEVLCYNNNKQKKPDFNWEKNLQLPFSVEIVNVSDMKAVYLRHIGPYKKEFLLFEKLFGKLCQWADAKKLIDPEKTKWFTLYHDSPGITSTDKLRISVCMTVETDVETNGAIGSIRVQGGKYAVGHFEINEHQYQEAWDAMFTGWLTGSKYQPDDRFCFELYQNNVLDKGQKHLVDIFIPIKPL